MKIVKSIMSILLLGISVSIYSQSIKPNSANSWTYGGGVGFSAGSNGGFGFSISPRVGYVLVDNLEAGLQLGYSLYNTDYYNSNMFNVGPYLTYYIDRQFFLSANFQEYFIDQKIKNGYSPDQYKYSDNESALYLGGGYMTMVGNNTYLQIGLAYNVLYKKDKSIFTNGLVPSIGIVFGI